MRMSSPPPIEVVRLVTSVTQDLIEESEKDVESEGLDTKALEAGHLGRAACSGKDAMAMFVEGDGEAGAQATIRATGNEDCLGLRHAREAMVMQRRES
jgi:hypothetical protein